jgi:hypothetical protein
VTFKEPELPVGTQLYLATEHPEVGKAMRWLSVSMPPSLPGSEPRRKRRDEVQAPAPAPTTYPFVTATEALDRVELAGETRAFIEDKLWMGAALIVSDQGISNETGKYTDFIVLTR